MNQIPILRVPCLFLLYFFWTGLVPLNAQSSCQITGDQMPCQNSEAEYLLTHNVPAPFSVVWQVLGGSVLDEDASSITVGWSLSGAHLVVANITGPGGTSTSCSYTVNVQPAPPLPALVDIASCPGEIVQVSTTSCNGCTYEWTTQGDLSISPVDQSGANLTINGSGEYCVEVTTAEGCVNSTCATVEIAPIEILPVAVTGGTNLSPNYWEICPTQSMTFSVDDPKGIKWVITDNFGTSWYFTGPEFEFNFPIPGATDYVVTGTLLIPRGDQQLQAGACLVIEPQYIHVLSAPPIPISCPSVVCEGDAVTYTVPESCGGGSWTVSPQGQIQGTPTATSITVVWTYDNDNPVGYITYSGNCPGYCSGPSIVEVPIIPNQGVINGPSIVCKLPTTLQWEVPYYVGGVYNWSFSPDPTAGVSVVTSSSPNIYRLAFSGSFQGSITIHLEFTHPVAGCSFTAEQVVTYEPFTNQINGPSTICAAAISSDQTYTYDYAGTLEWELRLNEGSYQPLIYSGTTSSNPHNFIIPANTFVPGKFYSLIVTSDQGCSQTKSIHVLDPISVKIVGPTTVCPNVSYTYTVIPAPGSNETIKWVVTLNGQDQPSVTSPTISVSWPPGTGHAIEVRRTVNGCTVTDGPIDITVLTPGEPLVIEGEEETCPDIIQSYSVSPAGGSNYVWTITDPFGVPSNLGSIFSGQGSSSVQVQWLGVLSPTVVHLNVSTDVCGVSSTATLVITITPLEIDLQTPDICEGEAAQLFTDLNSAEGYSVFLDGFAIYTNSPTLDPIPAFYLTAGTHVVLLVVQDPNGCSGPVSTTSQLIVHQNPPFEISLSDLIPCPEGTPFTRALSVSPSLPTCNYYWYLNGSPLGVNSPLLKISEIGTYTVVSECGDCPSRSATFTLDYDCKECCELDIEGNDIAVQITACSLSVDQCNLLEFSGTITPFSLAHNPQWIIEKPGGEIIMLPISGANGNFVQGSFQTNEVGIYRVYLSADELWADVFIQAYLPHNQYINFDNFCDFEDAGGPGTYPHYNVYQTGQPSYCNRTDYRNIQVPFIAKFAHEVRCNANGTFQVVANDISLYDTGVSSTINWTYPGGAQTGPELNIPSVPGSSTIEVCMQVTDQTGYSCRTCRDIQTPDQVSPGINVNSPDICQYQDFHFSPAIYPIGGESSVVSYYWTFGDGTFSYAMAPFKVYTDPGVYQVELTVETKNGCHLTTSITVTVHDYLLPEGEIVVNPGNCNSSAMLTFNQSAGPSVTDYLWSPANENLPTVTVFTSGSYALTVTGSNGCSNAINPVNVSLNAAFPETIFAYNNCGNTGANFIPVSGFDYEWTWSPTTPTPNQPYPGTNLNLSGANTYFVTVTAFQGGLPCATRELTLEAWPFPPVLPQVMQTTTCTNGEMWVQLTATNVPPDVEVSWYYLGQVISSAPSILVNQPGTYQIRYTNIYGCVRSTNVPINNLIDFSDFLSGCYDCHDIQENSPVYLNGIPGTFDSWYWEIDNSIPFGVQTGQITPLLLSTSYEKIRLCITQNGCSLCSDYFCIIGDCEVGDTCRVPLPTVRRVQCLDETVPGAPGMTRYFVHWDFPTDGVVMPCPPGAPDIFVAGMPNPVGQFESDQFEFEEIQGYWHFEGVFILDAAYSPAQVCWSIPFCLISTGAVCGTAQVCPVDYPNYDPYYSCTNPNGPNEECADMLIKVLNVVCEDNPNTSITHLVTLHIEATAPPTTCGEFAIQITSITGDLLYPISGQLSNLTGPTISTDVVVGWASNTANDILCLEVDLREDYDCWPLTYLDDPATPANEGGKICLKRECFNLTEYNCPDHIPGGESTNFAITATCNREKTRNGVIVYNVSMTSPFPINPLGFSLTPLSGSIQNLNFSGTTLTFEYHTVAGNLLFFATMINNGNTYYIQYLLGDCGYFSEGGFNGNGQERAANGVGTNASRLELFPNPTNGRVHIKYGISGLPNQAVQIDIYDLNGRQVRHFESAEATGTWATNVSEWNPGLYLVVLRDATGQIFESQKLMVTPD